TEAVEFGGQVAIGWILIEEDVAIAGEGVLIREFCRKVVAEVGDRFLGCVERILKDRALIVECFGLGQVVDQLLTMGDSVLGVGDFLFAVQSGLEQFAVVAVLKKEVTNFIAGFTGCIDLVARL